MKRLNTYWESQPKRIITQSEECLPLQSNNQQTLCMSSSTPLADILGTNQEASDLDVTSFSSLPNIELPENSHLPIDGKVLNKTPGIYSIKFPWFQYISDDKGQPFGGCKICMWAIKEDELPHNSRINKTVIESTFCIGKFVGWKNAYTKLPRHELSEIHLLVQNAWDSMESNLSIKAN